MGTYFIDTYSALHFMSGIVIEKVGVGFVYAFILHLIFEYLENTSYGVYIIRTYFTNDTWFSWPGGKRSADTWVNRVSDQLFFTLGWYASYMLL